MPNILAIYKNKESVLKAIVVADALYCGICKPKEDPIAMESTRGKWGSPPNPFYTLFDNGSLRALCFIATWVACQKFGFVTAQAYKWFLILRDDVFEQGSS